MSENPDMGHPRIFCGIDMGHPPPRLSPLRSTVTPITGKEM